MKIHQSIPLTRALTSSGDKDEEELKPWYLHGQEEFRGDPPWGRFENEARSSAQPSLF